MIGLYQKMLPYFTQDEVKRFQFICASMNLPLNVALCSPKLDKLWQPFLDRLNRMDPSISNKEPYTDSFNGWRYASFEMGFRAICDTQCNAIAIIKAEHVDLANTYLNAIDFTGLSLLQQLEKQHEALEKVRLELSKIETESNKKEIQTADDTRDPLSGAAPALTFAFEASKGSDKLTSKEVPRVVEDKLTSTLVKLSINN